MAGYLLIGSRDYVQAHEARRIYELATELVKTDGPVTVILVQNGVFAARVGDHGGWISELAKQGVRVLADDFSLRERGVPTARVSPDVRPASLDAVIDGLVEGRKVLWD